MDSLLQIFSARWIVGHSEIMEDGPETGFEEVGRISTGKSASHQEIKQ